MIENKKYSNVYKNNYSRNEKVLINGNIKLGNKTWKNLIKN